MNKKTRNVIIIVFSIALSLSVYGLIMFGLADFNDPTNDSGLRFDEDHLDYTRPGDYPFNNASDTKITIGKSVGNILWETRAIDIIIVGVLLMVASESAATMVKGIEDQCAEFRQELCETDKFIILEQKEAEELEEVK